MRGLRVLVLLSAIAFNSGEVSAQASAPSPVEAVLAEARRALDDLRYRTADSLAHSLLASTVNASRSERMQALMIATAALYPELGARPYADSARRLLQQLLRLDPQVQIPADIRTPDLEALLEDTRRTTFAVAALPKPAYQLQSTSADTVIEVSATVPARFRLEAVSRRGERVALDSLPPGEVGRLRLALFDGDQRRLADGEWELQVQAHRAGAADSVVLRFPLNVLSTPFILQTVPAHVDSTRLLPERAMPRRWLTLVTGLAVGGVAFGSAQLLRGEAPVADANPQQAHAAVAAGALALGGVLAAVTERERPLQSNIAANQRLRDAFTQARRQALEENERRRTAFTATLRIGEKIP